MSILNKITVLKDRLGNKIIPMTLTKAVQDDTGKKLNVILDEKLDGASVVNTSTQVETDKKALNAVQNNPDISGTLANKIFLLNNDRGYLDTKAVSTTWTSVIKNGKYVGYNLTDAPEQGTFLVDVTVYNTNNIVQIGTNTFTKNTWKNVYNGTSWTGWQQIATTTKTEIPFPFTTGYTSWLYRESKIEKDSINRGLLVIYVTKTDGTDFTANQIYSIGTLPVGYTCKTSSDSAGSCLQTTEGSANGLCLVGVYNNVVTLIPFVTCKVMCITLPYSVG